MIAGEPKPFKTPKTLRDRIEEICNEAMDLLVREMNDEKNTKTLRVQIAQDLLDRGRHSRKGSSNSVEHDHRHVFTSEKLVLAAQAAREIELKKPLALPAPEKESA